MELRIFFSLAIGKLLLFLLQNFKIGGGTAAPGYYALKIYPNLISVLGKNIPQTVVITGTNGKTTTAKLLAHFVQKKGLKIIRNSTGSNLERGIASALISCSPLGGGRVDIDLAIWELDEAAFNQVVPKIKPNAIVFLNAFRDQLDRYGEVDSVIKKWCQSISNVNKDTVIYLNGDDKNLLQLKKYFSGKVITFGLESAQIKGERTLSKLKEGGLDLKATNIINKNLEKTNFEMKENENKFKVLLPLSGIYNIYNFLAAFSLAKYLQIPSQTIISSLGNFSPAFGRMEKFELPTQGWKAKTEGYIFLIKNPVGATQVFEAIKDQLKKSDRLLIALNDNLADGTDVSWIWDANFEELRIKNYELRIFCSGTRAEDLVVRLKYAGFDQKAITVENNLKKAFRKAQEGLKGRLFILPTYTALLEFQKILTKEGIKEYYWKESL